MLLQTPKEAMFDHITNVCLFNQPMHAYFDHLLHLASTENLISLR